MALGMTEQAAFSCLRFSLGRFNQLEELPLVVRKVVEKLVAMVTSICDALRTKLR